MTEKNFLKFNADVVNGQCPNLHRNYCISWYLLRDFFRCMSCGADLEQHVNGKISYTYLPSHAPTDGGKPFVREWRDDDGQS
jgi:hypothetical protein